MYKIARLIKLAEVSLKEELFESTRKNGGS